MTRHRTITGFLAVALLAVAATAATMRSHLHWADATIDSAARTMLNGSTFDANIAAASFEDRWSALSAPPTDTPER